MPEHRESSILDRLFNIIFREVFAELRGYLQKQMRRFFRIALLCFLGAALAAGGLLFLALGFVKYLSLLMPSWLAWILVGLIVFFLGIVLAMVARIKSQV